MPVLSMRTGGGLLEYAGSSGVSAQRGTMQPDAPTTVRTALHAQGSSKIKFSVRSHSKQHMKLKTLKWPHWFLRGCACISMCVRAFTIVDGLFSEGSNIRHGHNRRELGDLTFIVFSFERPENSTQSHRFCCSRSISVVHVLFSCLMAFTCHSPHKPISTVKMHHCLASFIHASPEWTDKGESFIVF